MAFNYFGSEEDREQGNTGDDAQQQSGQGQMLGSESPVVTGNNASAGDAGKGTASGTFTNLQSYLDKNSSLGFGSQVAGKVGQSVDEAEQAQHGAESQFKSMADQGTVRKDDNLLNSLNDAPDSIANDEQKYGSFTKMRDAQYGGPNQFTDTDLYQPTYAKTEKAKQTVDSTASEGGRKAYLDQEYGSGKGRYDYSQGQRKLDNLLIQNDPNSKAAFEGVQNRANAASQGFQGLSTALDQYAQQGRQTSQQTRQDTRKALGIDDPGLAAFDEDASNNGAIQNYIEPLDQQVSQQRAKLLQDQQAIQPYANTNVLSGLSPEMRQRLGLQDSSFGAVDLRPNSDYEGGQAPSFYNPYQVDAGAFAGAKPGDFVNFQNDADYNRGSMSTADQQAKIAALQKLAGQQSSFLPEGVEAGSMLGKPTSTVNSQGFQDKATAQRTALQSELQAALDHFKQVAAGSAQQSPSGGTMTSGGLIDASQIKAVGNQIRAKYGLPPL